MNKPNISAVVCTFNRAQYLRPAVESLYRQSLSPDVYEVLVVDNASTDETQSVVESLREAHPSLRYIREPRPGLVYARNAGAGEAKGDFIAYIDDDAQADETWLESLVKAFAEVDPSPAVVGGRVFLDWGPGGRPSWLPDAFLSLYSQVDHGNAGHGLLLADEYVVGANFALNRSVLLESGGFSRGLGRSRSGLLAGEETEIVNRLERLGHVVYYAPDAVVRHTVQHERASGRWLRSRIFWDGASQPVLEFGREQGRQFYARRAAYEAKQTGLFGLLWLRTMASADREARLTQALATIRRAGRVRTNLALALAPGKPRA